jgi:hypothetical protein
VFRTWSQVRSIKIQGAKLDIDYVERWVAALDIEDQWHAARDKAG